MATFVDMILYLERLGLTDVLLPFLLVFTIVFAILSNTKILGESAKKLNVIVALALGFAVVIPHVLGTYPPGMNAVLIINSMLPQVAIVIVAIIMFLLLLGSFGGQWDLKSGYSASWVIVFSIAVITYIFGTSAGWWGNGRFPWFLAWLANPATQSLIITLLVFGVVIWFITREEKDEDDDDRKRKDENKERYWGWKGYDE